MAKYVVAAYLNQSCHRKARGIFARRATKDIGVAPVANITGADWRASHMRIHATAGILFCCVTLGAALGCSNQPTAPSSLGSPTVGAGSTKVSSGSPQTAVSPSRFGNRTPGVVYVTSQGLYYDTFVVKDPLPMQGRFQLLVNGETEFGPGQPGYLGGRWWEDTNGNGVQDAEDHFFLCPLLPPGRPTP